MAKVHRLKTIKPFHSDVWCGRKTFEVRKDDRGYEVGDYLVLDEYEGGKYTEAKPLVRIVDYLLRGGQFGIEPGYVVLGIDKLAYEHAERTILDVAPPRGLAACSMRCPGSMTSPRTPSR